MKVCIYIYYKIDVFLDAMPHFNEETLKKLVVRSTKNQEITLTSICIKYNIKKGILIFLFLFMTLL